MNGDGLSTDNNSLNHPLAPYIQQAGAKAGIWLYNTRNKLLGFLQQKPYNINPDTVSEMFGPQTNLLTTFISWRLPAPTVPMLPPVVDIRAASFANYDVNSSAVAEELGDNMFDPPGWRGHLIHK